MLVSVEEEILRAQVEGELRTQLNAALKKYDSLKRDRDDYTEAIFRAAKSAASAMIIPPVQAPKADKRSKQPETAIAVLGDFQLGKLTAGYNSVICEERIDIYADKVIKLTEIQRADHPVNDLQIFVLGDIVEGELIFPSQQWQLDSSLYQQTVLDAPRILTNFIRKMLANFSGKITVHMVIGNHGAIGGSERRNMNPESNADRMAYRITQLLLKDEKRVSFNIPDGSGESHWYTVAEVFPNYKVLLFHGYNLRGGSGFPWYGLMKKVGGWALGAIPEVFHDTDFGHWHQPTRVTLNRVTARCNGSPESHNTFAQEALAAVGRPSQGLRFVHPKHGVTAEYVVYLDTDNPVLPQIA